MDIYLDKENMIMFLSINNMVDDEVRAKFVEAYKKSDFPYKVIVFDNINEFEII
ncbi:hypothetical protein NGH74_13880 [Staphylococcus pseudoxylosus]|uniref:hypothetical protein n=1 Tax=Staphylococcus pseudoxylosus TaxID=2282419 RepID=UPI002DB84BDB|nr:hypothetical protein [Staphylococcus pseudoxylosus]MEB8088250.1 hypothetical protein [Staphylococcus pseudoxylosus]